AYPPDPFTRRKALTAASRKGGWVSWAATFRKGRASLAAGPNSPKISTSWTLATRAGLENVARRSWSWVAAVFGSTGGSGGRGDGGSVEGEPEGGKRTGR